MKKFQVIYFKNSKDQHRVISTNIYSRFLRVMREIE